MKIFSTFVIVLLAAVLFLGGCREKKPHGTEITRQQVSGVALGTAAQSVVDDIYETSGTVRAKTVSAVASRVMGTVTSVRVKEGDRVRAGQVLLTIEDSDLVQKMRGASEGKREAEKALDAAQVKRTLSEITYYRYKKLFDEKALSAQELDQIETQKKMAVIDYERAKAAVQRADAGVNESSVFHGFAKIKSPVSGIVTEKRIDPGSMAVPGMPLLTVEDVSSYTIEISADESLVSKMKSGMKTSVFIQGREIPGTIAEINSAVDPATRTFIVKISLKGDGLRSGLYGKVAIPVGKRETMLLPAKAVIERGQLTGIYVVDNGVLTYRLVRIGRKHGEKVEILSGLNPGERVVVEGAGNAVDGGILADK